MRDTWRAIRASVVGLVIAAALLTSWLALPQSVAACSCASGDLAAWAKFPGILIFSGTVRATDASNLEVAVDRWFHGDGIEPLVRLDPAGFGSHGESCQIAPPPPGSRWLFAVGRQPGTGLVSLNLCSVRGDLSTAEGRALLAAAVRMFPNAAVPSPPATDELAASSPATPSSTAPALAAAPPPDPDRIPQIATLVALAVAATGLGLLLLATRRRPGASG
jgi:hypothetical protein